MKLYIEVIVLLVLIIMFLLWRLWLSRTQKKLLKNYNPDDDKARRCETFFDRCERVSSIPNIPEPIADTNADIGTGEQPVERTISDDNRPYQSERYKLLSSTRPR